LKYPEFKKINNRKIVGIYLSWLVGFMMFNATFNNISAISWRSVLLVEETRVLGETQFTDKLYHIMLYRHFYREKSLFTN
jgi:hypothetical protein